MRLVAIAICVSAVAAADPWADWVGDYAGPLRWTNCSTPHAATAKLAIDATDAVLAYELAGLPGLSLVAEDAAWVAQQADLTVRLTRPRADALDVNVRFESGCAARGTLVRATTGIAACDRLVAWARIEARCTKLTAPPLEPQVGRERAGWSALRGAARGKAAEACEARASRVERELVEAGCAPDPDPTIGVRAPQCLALLTASGRVERCAAVPPEVKAMLSREAQALAAAAQTGEPSTVGVVDAQCRDARETIEQIAARLHCP